MNRMGRPPKEDRGSVAETTLTIRLTLAEKAGLERIVEHRQAELQREYGPGVQFTMAGFIRSMIARELAAFEKQNTAPTQPSPVEQKTDPQVDFATVLEAVRADAKRLNLGGLAEVPSIVRALECSMSMDRVHAALVFGVETHALELRQDSSPDTLKGNAALCPKGPRGTVLSMVREIGDEPAELDPEKLRTRIERALNSGRFESAAALAREADVAPNDVSRLRNNRTVPQEKLVKLDAMLTATGC